jgi:hypothetical protein
MTDSDISSPGLPDKSVAHITAFARLTMLIEAREICFPKPQILPADFGPESDSVDAFRRVFKKTDWADLGPDFEAERI